MQDFSAAFGRALELIFSAEPELLAIIQLSLSVSALAVLLSALLALPLGAVLAMCRFPGRGLCIALVNALMGLPPVVVGLMVYLLLSRAGPLGFLGWLYTPSAMILAQTILVTPILLALSREVLATLDSEYRELLTLLGAGPLRRLGVLLWEGRFALLTVLLAGFGRAIAEVGAVMIVGGNIAGSTRVMTTAIALETSKGALDLALGLGLVLLALAFAVNLSVTLLRMQARSWGHD